MSVLNPHCFRFGKFTLDPDQKVLLRDDKPLPLTPKLFDTLLILLEANGRLVQKEELMRRVWPDTFVEDANLTSNVQQLRKCLSDDARHPCYIETVAKRGYRFIAPITTAETDANQPPTKSKIVETLAASPEPTVFRPAWLAPVLMCLVIAATGAIWFAWSRTRMAAQPNAGRTMLAVLPFKNLTGDTTQEYFDDGLTEEMIAQLGKLDSQRLGVIARTSVMHYKSSEQPLNSIGNELGVQFVLEGSVRRDSDKVRITAQLIRVADQTHVWAREYDRELNNLLVLQGEIAQEVADEIQLTLGVKRPPEPISPTVSSPSYEAYDFYLKGEYFWNKRTVEGFRQSIDFFQQAAQKDPRYARAYAGLANSYVLMGGYSGQQQADFIAKARTAALRALSIDENLPEAHTALALIVQNYDWDWETAEHEFRRAIDLNPNYATAHQWYAEHLALLGHFDDALRESESARELDPFSLIIATDNAGILYFSRQYDRAAEKLRAVLEVDPNFLRAHMLAHVYVQNRMFTQAQADLATWCRLENTPWSLAESAYVLGRSGQLLQAHEALNRLEQLDKGQLLDPELMVWAALGMGDKDQAFAFLEKAYTQHSNILTRLKVDPAFDELRDDPRFKELLRRTHMV
ncbi:MAG: winged helix-turn-helix domain-containing protein [Pyrinomonadaceae bacterium]